MFNKVKYILKKNINMKTSYVVSITIFSLFLIVGGISVAIYTSQAESRGSLNIVTGELYDLLESSDFTDGTKVSILPSSEKEIIVNLKNTNPVDIKANLYYQEEQGVEVGYINHGNLPPKENGIVIKEGQEKEYTIKLKNTTSEEKQIEFGSKIGLSSKTLEFPKDKKVLSSFVYKEELLKGSDPVLGKDMVPIMIDGNGKVREVDLSEEWYNYGKKNWANAVILVDNPSKEYNINDIILEQDIESYFVWIPRYKYQIFDLGNYNGAPTIDYIPESVAQTIQIEFQNKNDLKESGDEEGEYLTHPAFTLGQKELSGIWVGKFETGYNQTGDGSNPINTDGWSLQNAEQDEINSNKIIIKPSVYSWRNITVYKIFMNAFNYNRTLDSHMMKNIEWGAVAYLSHSEYGTNKEVNVNNNSSYLTGYSATEEAKQNIGTGTYGTSETITQKYNTETGYKASTTGNISGIYDMSGGTHEFVAAYQEGYGLETYFHEANGFSQEDLTNYASYFNVYVANSGGTDYYNRKLGDATGEMGPFYKYTAEDTLLRVRNSWYEDYSYMTASSIPWFHRGGCFSDETLASQFYFSRDKGIATPYLGSRLVLAPEK